MNPKKEFFLHTSIAADEHAHSGLSDAVSTPDRPYIVFYIRILYHLSMLPDLLNDLRYAIRVLRQNPLFALVSILSLALGIGANAALFSVVDTLLLKALPYKNADRLVYVSEFWPHEPEVPGPPNTDLSNWLLKSQLAEQIAAYGGGRDASLTGIGDPERIPATSVTYGLLDLTGARMALGRYFTPEEDSQGGPMAVILGYKLWQRKFGGSPEIVGKQIELDGVGHQVVGVLPSGFAFPDNGFHDDLLIPMQVAIDPGWHNDRDFRLLRVIARLKPGVSPSALRSEFAAIVRANTAAEPAQFVTMRKDMEVRVTPLRDWLTGGVRRMVLVLEATVALLLLIACLNIASLQVARAAFRGKEMALRAAIGAGRARLIRQLLTESLLLATVGGGLGLAFGYLSLGPLRAFLPANLHLADGIRMNGSVLWFTLAIAVLTGILAGIAPAITASRPDLQDAIKQGGASRSRQSLHGALVVAEIAIATILLIGCGLFVRTFVRLASADPGFHPDGVLTLKVALPNRAYPDSASWKRFSGQLVDRAQSIPGVESAAVSGGLPVVGTRAAAGVSIQGEPTRAPGGRPSIPVAGVTPDYFHALGIPILRGRAFTRADAAGPQVAIVDQAFAQRFLPGQDALGKRIHMGSGREPWREIVGIAGNVTAQAWGPMSPYVIYWPATEQTSDEGEQQVFLVLKSSRVPPEKLIAAATTAVHELDPNLPVFDVAAMDERLGISLSAQRANMTLMSVFAALALLLAAIGIFAMTAYFVSQRLHELGIRVALGATRGAVLQMILKKGMRLTAAGLILGIAGALALTRTVSSLLEGVRSNDPVAFTGAAALFALVAAAACLVPAIRASRADPMVTLRHD